MLTCADLIGATITCWCASATNKKKLEYQRKYARIVKEETQLVRVQMLLHANPQELTATRVWRGDDRQRCRHASEQESKLSSHPTYERKIIYLKQAIALIADVSVHEVTVELRRGQDLSCDVEALDRTVALCMGLHTRLGAQCTFREFDQRLLRMCLSGFPRSCPRCCLMSAHSGVYLANIGSNGQDYDRKDEVSAEQGANADNVNDVANFHSDCEAGAAEASEASLVGNNQADDAIDKEEPASQADISDNKAAVVGDCQAQNAIDKGAEASDEAAFIRGQEPADIDIVHKVMNASPEVEELQQKKI